MDQKTAESIFLAALMDAAKRAYPDVPKNCGTGCKTIDDCKRRCDTPREKADE